MPKNRIRAIFVGLVTLVAVLAVLAVKSLGDKSPATPRANSRTETTKVITIPTPTTTTQPKSTELKDDGEGWAEELTKEDFHVRNFSGISDPSNSNLPKDVFADVTNAAAAYLEAKLTGIGADAWSDYIFFEIDGAPRYTAFEVVEIGALSRNSKNTKSSVLVVWKARDSLTNTEVTYRQTLQFKVQSGRWVPA